MPGVEVAAPIAVIGHVAPHGAVLVDTGQSDAPGASTVRIDATWFDPLRQPRAAHAQYLFASASAIGRSGPAAPGGRV